MRVFRGTIADAAAMCTVLGAICLSPHALAQQITKIESLTFKIPENTNLAKVASEQLVKWPVVADWDTQGNLLVVESGGVSSPIEEHNARRLHRIVRLTDLDQDGVFDQRTVVADQLPFTEGVLCLGDRLLACSPPYILELTDRDQDGIYEDESVWFDGQTITFCANDLHGPYLGRDGWIYWCKGAFGKQSHELIDGRTLTSEAAHIFRRKVSGGPIEPVMSGGMDNPVEVAITPEGERFFTSTFLHHPGNGLRDGIAHAIYGGLYGKEHAPIYTHFQTGSLMPIMTELGPAAPSGLAMLENNELLGNTASGSRVLAAALFNLQKVSAHILMPNGSTYTTTDVDLVVADRIDFHPTDILEDADGSLLIVDTGGWYDLCCPTSKIDQTTASGGIYRLSSTTNTKTPRSQSSRIVNWSEQGLEDLVQRIYDPRPWIARQATFELREGSEGELAASIELLSERLQDEGAPVRERLQALWTLCALDSSASLQAIATAMVTENESLLQAACHAISVQRFAPALPQVENMLSHQSPAIRRAAAEAVGRLGNPKSVAGLMELLADGTVGRTLEHSAIYALIELGDAHVLQPYLSRERSINQRHAATVAMSQLQAYEMLPVTHMLDMLSATDSRIQESAARILSQQPELAESYRESLVAMFDRPADEAHASSLALKLVAGWRETEVVQGVLGDRLAQAAELPIEQQRSLLKAIDLYSHDSLPTEWNDSLVAWLDGSDRKMQLEICKTLEDFSIENAEELRQALLRLASETESRSERIQILAALPTEGAPIQRSLELTIMECLQSEDQMLVQQAKIALGRIQLSPKGALLLMDSISQTSAQDVFAYIEAINRLGDDSLDVKLLGMLGNVPAAKTISASQLTNLYRTRSASLQSLAQERLTLLSKSPESVESSVISALANLPDGDIAAGFQLFRSSKALCSSCHKIGYVGGEIGPELTRIGSTRTRNALLEAILFPNARLEQSYRSTKILTTDGQVFNGLVKNQSDPTRIELQISADKSVTIRMVDIEEQQPSDISIMPSGLADQLTLQELADLLAFLESAR